MKAMAKQRISLECLSYHASAPADEARRLKVRNSSDDIDYIAMYFTKHEVELFWDKSGIGVGNDS